MFKIMKKIISTALMLLCAGCLMAQEPKAVEGRSNFGAMMFVAPEPVIMIATYDAHDNPDVMMAVWGCQCAGDKVKIHLSDHQTTENLQLKKAFTMSFATKATVAESDYFGEVSAREVKDKVARVGFTAHKSPNVDAPIIDQYPVTLECVVESFDNGVLVGRVVNTSAAKEVLDAEGNVDLGKLQPVAFDPVNNTYRIVGDVVGHAWKSGDKFK